MSRFEGRGRPCCASSSRLTALTKLQNLARIRLLVHELFSFGPWEATSLPSSEPVRKASRSRQLAWWAQANAMREFKLLGANEDKPNLLLLACCGPAALSSTPWVPRRGPADALTRATKGPSLGRIDS